MTVELDGVKQMAGGVSPFQPDDASPSQPHNDHIEKSEKIDSVDASTAIFNGSDFVVESETSKLSKNQRKKLKRKQDWEDGREARKARRKEKNKERKARKRAATHEGEEETEHTNEHGLNQISNSTSLGVDDSSGLVTGIGSDELIHPSVSNGVEKDSTHPTTYCDLKERKKYQRPVQLPLTLVYDCAFDDKMTDTELISLASQLTRAYSDNRKAKYRIYMVVSSFGGKLKERFEGILGKHHENWKGVTFTESDFVQASELARLKMRASASKWELHQAEGDQPSEHKQEPGIGSSAVPDSSSGNVKELSQADIFCEGAGEQPEVVYLTSDSPHVLEYLKPYSTYIIGGLVDKNRHKGICYKRACDHSVETAKLPIGEYMKMSSRQVLATNHVGEIMLKWLECSGDWGRAFDRVIPKRKGGVLKERTDEHTDDPTDEEDQSTKVDEANPAEE